MSEGGTDTEELSKNEDKNDEGTINQNEETQDKNEKKEILPGFETFDDFVKTGFSVLKAGIKASNSLPAGENFNYYGCFPTFNKVRATEIKKLMNTMQSIIECTGAAGSIKRRDPDEKFDLLAEANDILLDRATLCMDEEAGLPKEKNVQLITTQTKQNNYGSWNTSVIQSTPSSASSNPSQAIRLLAAKNIHRPQLSFKDKIDNSAKPWEPRIKDKPNSIKPLALYLIETENGSAYCHPYECELDQFSPPDPQLIKKPPIKHKTLDETPLIVIEKPQDIKILLEDLQNYDEIAIDLEHHSYRTFQGITCLMQISTRDTDYLIDTLSLRSELHVLNEIFTKPSILKVFHGAECDIQWLQRDLSLYIVNMFDTHQAAKHLNLPYLSLAYLLKTHCGVDPNKHFQLADWRIRPLPSELMKYAREDTHYLLYIKDILRNLLIDASNGQSNILKAVYNRSTEIAKRIYEKPVCNEDSYMSMYRKSQKMFNNRQLFALKELYIWRDGVARVEDDSYGYVLPNHMLLNIAETLPREMQGILACCNPIPPLVRQNLLKLHKLILKAREQPLIKPVLEEDIRQRLTQRNQAVVSDGWIWSPHDMSSEVKDNLPCLLNATEREVRNSRLVGRPTVTIFESPPSSDDEGVGERLQKMKTLFVSPFERYKRVIPMVAAQEERERMRKEEEEKERIVNAKREVEDTQSSIERVHEHFLKLTENIQGREEKEAVGAMAGSRKRKRGEEEVEVIEERDFDSSTPRPGRDCTVADGFRGKRKKEEGGEERGNNGLKKRGKNGERVLQGVRVYSGSTDKTKAQKRKNRSELANKGMLPREDFDYKAVDFSSFQGGSRGATSKIANLQNQKLKNQVKNGSGKKKKKKQKLGI